MRYGWSLNRNHWQDLRMALPNSEWKRTYLHSDYLYEVPTYSGVYLICAYLKHIPISGGVMECLYNAIYAGQALNLRNRFSKHVHGYRYVVKAKSTFRSLDFWYIHVDRNDLSDIEQHLINAFGPTANVKNVKAKIGMPISAGSIKGTNT